jgi:hypothetical protein
MKPARSRQAPAGNGVAEMTAPVSNRISVLSSARGIALDVVQAIHDRQIAEHGGGDGLRDGGLLSSALARPENAAAYGTPDAAGGGLCLQDHEKSSVRGSQ